MSLNIIRKINQAGDTIVEVMVAITVISVILAGAYVSANHSLNNSRQAQERGEALKVAESQLEHLKSLAVTSPSTVFDSTPYCIDSSGVKKTGSGVPCLYAPRYNVTDTYTAASNDISVKIEWDSLRGGKDQIIMLYRLYQ